MKNSISLNSTFKNKKKVTLINFYYQSKFIDLIFYILLASFKYHFSYSILFLKYFFYIIHNSWNIKCNIVDIVVY